MCLFSDNVGSFIHKVILYFTFDFWKRKIFLSIVLSLLLLLSNADAHTIDFHLKAEVLWWGLDITGGLKEVNVVSINDHFLSEIGFTEHTNLMWW